MSLMRIDFAAIEKLIDTFDLKLYRIPYKVQKEMIQTAADSVLKEVKKNARELKNGKYALPEGVRDTIANAAYVDKRHMADNPPYALINFRGTVSRYYEPRATHPVQKNGQWFVSRKRGIISNGERRIAEVAFLNEYGVPKNLNQGARGYLSQAMADGMEKAIKPILDILEEFVASAISSAI